ncbi:MAG: hypothetical protein JRC90_11410 [Deltaproteobacteria bacterium]|nr:hypothetical protein [Deltaproteobacteria bacterium]
MAKIFRSSVINAPIDEVWARIRDFNALPDLWGILLLQIATLKMTSQVIKLAASETSTSKMMEISGNDC